MPDKEIITLDAAQVAAERFLEDRLKNIKNISIDKVKLASVEGIIVYDIEGITVIGGKFLSKNRECRFKIQVSATDGAVVGYETEG